MTTATENQPGTRPKTQSGGNALVTGAGHRIGRAFALGLAKRGWNVAVHYHGSDIEAGETAALIEEAGASAALVQADLANIDQTSELISQAAAALGPLSCLINNASAFEFDDVRTATPQSWDLHLNVNLRAPFFLSQSFAAQIPQDIQANIINIIDQRVWKLTPDFMSYTTSKAGLWTLTQTLAQALAPQIRVNAIAPGPTLKGARQSNAHFERQVEATLLQRQPHLEEFANALDFILETPSLTGQMIALDSGQHLAWQTPDVVGVDI